MFSVSRVIFGNPATSKVYKRPNVIKTLENKGVMKIEQTKQVEKASASALERKTLCWVRGGKAHDAMSKAVEKFVSKNSSSK